MRQMAQPITPAARSRRWRLSYRLVAIAFVVAAGGALAVYVYADRMVERHLRPATIELLERRFDSKVELAGLSVRVLPSLSIRGEGLTLRHQGRTDIPPRHHHQGVHH